MCEDCEKNPIVNTAMGKGKNCGHTTSTRGLAWCPRCAAQKNVCAQCGKSLAKK